MEHFQPKCPSCGKQMIIRDISCSACNVHLQGEIPLPRLAQLDPEDREFIEMFVAAGGSLKEIGHALGISYPTVRIRLDNVIEKLKSLHAEEEKERLKILEKLEKGELTAKEAVNMLRYGKEKPEEKIIKF